MARADRVWKRVLWEVGVIESVQQPQLQKKFKPRNESSVAGFYTHASASNFQKEPSKEESLPLFLEVRNGPGEVWAAQNLVGGIRAGHQVSGWQLLSPSSSCFPHTHTEECCWTLACTQSLHVLGFCSTVFFSGRDCPWPETLHIIFSIILQES